VKGKLGPGIRRVDETAFRQGPLGLPLGGRNLQRNSGQYGPSVRSGDCWREQSGRKALPGDRRWNERVNRKLSGCSSGSEGTGSFLPQTCDRGWSHGVLGGLGRSLSSNDASAVLGS